MSQNQSESQKEVFEFLEDFKTAVYNGQLRLAFENLVPVIDAIVDALASDEEEVVDNQTVEPVSVSVVETPAPPAVEELKQETVKPQKKTQESNDK